MKNCSDECPIVRAKGRYDCNYVLWGDKDGWLCLYTAVGDFHREEAS